MSDSKPVRRRKIAGERRAQVSPPTDGPGAPVTEARVPKPVEHAAEAGLSPDVRRPAPGSTDPAPRPIPGWLLGGLAVLLIAAVAFDLVVGFRTHRVTQQRTTESAAITSAFSQAPAQAESAATHVLAYDYKTLQHDADEAKSYMTPDYAQQFQRTVEQLLTEPAGQVRAHVAASVKASGVVSATPAKVDVMMFVDMTSTTTAHREPQTYLNRVVFTMVRSGDRWLVSDVTAL